MMTAASNSRVHLLAAAVLAATAFACSAQQGEGEVGVSVAALSVCDETVPANRNVDGIPSYAQCSASNSAAIYSNDGVNTATTQMGPDWVRTQYSGGYQCTELAHRYLYFRWDIDWVPRGNAGTWCDSQPPASIGVVQTMEPVHGDIMVLAPGSCGADGTTGHVTVVDVVNDGGMLTVVEQNGARRGNYKVTCAKCFLHVMANDGTPGGVAGSPGDPGGMAGAPSSGAGSGAPPPATTPPATVPPPPATTPPPTTPPPSVPSTPAPAPASPVPATPPPAMPPPVTAPTAAPAPMAAQPFTSSPRENAVADDSGCAVSRPGRTDRSGTAWSLVLIGAALVVAARRRRAVS